MNDITNPDFSADGRCRMGRIWADSQAQHVAMDMPVLADSDGEKLRRFDGVVEMLGQLSFDSNGVLHDKVELAIQRLKAFEPPEGYYVAFSGGKDSQCIYHLCQMAGVKFDAHYNVTSVDPPELVQFIRRNYPDVEFTVPHDKDGKRISMWSLIPERLMPPTRIVRYCCQQLKETQGEGRVTVTGVRWAESANRKVNQGIVTIPKKNKRIVKDMENMGVNFTKTRRGGWYLTTMMQPNAELLNIA